MKVYRMQTSTSNTAELLCVVILSFAVRGTLSFCFVLWLIYIVLVNMTWKCLCALSVDYYGDMILLFAVP